MNLPTQSEQSTRPAPHAQSMPRVRFIHASAKATALGILALLCSHLSCAQVQPQTQPQVQSLTPSQPLPISSEAAAPLPYAEEPRWVAPIFDSVDSALKSSPPVFPEPIRRVEALMLLDGPLHLQQANRFPSAHQFLIHRLDDAISSMESTRVTTGAKIWKTYNHGFVVRTPSITVGIDLVRGWHAARARFTIPTSSTARLVDQIDVLALSHYHGDHCDPDVRDAALNAGVTILADKSIYPNTTPTRQLIRPSRLDAKQIETGTPSPVFNVLETSNGKRLEYLAYPGHQGADIPNNWFLFRTPEGFTFMHTGDEAFPDDFSWIDKVASQQRVDVLLVNSWTSNIGRLVHGVRPKLVILGHEAEMGHIPEQRQAYWDSYKASRGTGAPAMVTGWGEMVEYPLPSNADKKR